MTRCRVVNSVLVVPDTPTWGAQLLGPGSVLDVETEPSPGVLGIDEIAVRWVDVAGRETGGWIAQTALVEPATRAQQHALVNVRNDLDMEPFDRLRDYARSQQLKDPRGRWTFPRWLRIFGDAHINALAAAVRELGGIVRGTETSVELGRRVLRLAVNQEHLMSTDTDTSVEETAAPTKSKKASKPSASKPAVTKGKPKAEKTAPAVEKPAKAAKSPAKKAAATESSDVSASQRLGESLVKLLKKVGNPDPAAGIAEKMATGKAPTAKQLTQLRDGINEAASLARSKDKGELASELSAANRNVRRLARSAAAE